jgi:Ser/Thr protein kinase RdoA (MazF antagonist)
VCRTELTAAVEAFARTHLGARPARWCFVSRRRATTCGVRLADGRAVVVKLHPADGPTRERLDAVQEVQRHLAGRGFPCPRPLAPPTLTAAGLATAETMLLGGRSPDPRSRADRQAMARGLAAVTEACLPLRHLEALDADRIAELREGSLWPSPADPRLSFDGGHPEADWIDAVGARARGLRRRTRDGARVVGHGDWHVEHVRIAGGRPVAVYDWDALVRASEPFLVGCAVGGFTADWRVDEPPVVPTLEEAGGFIAGYAAARQRPFSSDEHAAILGHWLEMTAYAARVELAREVAGVATSRRYRDALAGGAAEVLVDVEPEK